ncbi:hypothetical protein SAMN05428984_1661 [Sphingomonas sp. OK281]|nr:hypothetical protein SAMN05428984_1661 [Sphingomonas sp. OK281]
MALLDHTRGWFLTVKPRTPSAAGTAAVFALGDRVLAQKGLNPKVVDAVKRSIENDRRIQARKMKAVAGN